MNVDVDVAIVGFGPGGEVLASLLGQAGHRVVVFEKFAAPYGLPRMSTLDGEIARLLQHTSDPAKAMEGTIPQPNYMFFGADGEPALEVDWRTPICGQPARLSLHQPNIESAMEERIASCPSVDVRWGREVTGLEELDGAVRVTARTSAESGKSPSEEQVLATYVTGMDGASSFVRQALGIELEVLHTHDDTWYLTDFDIVDPSIDPPGTILVMNPEGPYFWGPNGAGRCRTDVRVMGDVDPADLADHEHGYAWLEENIGIPRDKVRITRRVLYRFRSQYAKSYRKGQIFLGGDAAHAMTPYLAQGSCSAMRDGANLAWKLDLVLTGRAAPELLDSYEAERLPHAAAIVHGSLAAWGMMIEQDPQKVAARDAYMRSGQAEMPPIPDLGTGVLHTEPDGGTTAPVGALSPQGRVRLDGREDLLDNLIGYGAQLVTRDPLDDALGAEHRSRLVELGVKLVVLGEGPGQVVDLDGVYGRFLDEHGVSAYLSRPDFYIFGVAQGPEATVGLVENFFQQLAPATSTVPA